LGRCCRAHRGNWYLTLESVQRATRGAGSGSCAVGNTKGNVQKRPKAEVTSERPKEYQKASSCACRVIRDSSKPHNQTTPPRGDRPFLIRPGRHSTRG